ncbi:UNVERIFIED_CONTAM: hypothetical protein PYX00_003138 [Menopon gallinae]|uniref:C2H2-type domain-containing protein n=1 Tax=Menopon gallinae TaxID=328185 RepID=A0AAW2HZ98_9NEOP
MEGVLSDAEVVYYENGSNSGLSSAESTDGRVAIEEADAEEKEEVEEEKEEEEEEEEEEVRLEEKPNANCEKKYRVLIKTAPEYQSATEAQAKAYKKIGDDTLKSPCPYCNKLLTRVDEHIRLMHRNKVYICTKFNCGAQFTTLKNLQSHQLTCYDVEKAYKCHYCYKEFHRKSNYKAHVRRHNSKKEFQCQLCDSAFVDTTGLRRHFLKHHEPEREVFVSNCCGKRFKSKEGLKKHINRRICGIEVIQVVDPSPIEVPM